MLGLCREYLVGRECLCLNVWDFGLGDLAPLRLSAITSDNEPLNLSNLFLTNLFRGARVTRYTVVSLRAMQTKLHSELQ